MNSRDVLGKKIVVVEQTRRKSNSGMFMNLDRLLLEDGTEIVFTVIECENDYGVKALIRKGTSDSVSATDSKEGEG